MIKKKLFWNICTSSILTAALFLGGCSSAKTQTASVPKASSPASAASASKETEPEADSEDNAQIPITDYSDYDISDMDRTDYYHDFQKTGGQIALVAANSSSHDKSYLENAYSGMQIYAQAAGVSYSVYGAAQNTCEEYLSVIKQAISDGASLILCAGPSFSEPVGILQDTYPDIHFLMLDGIPEDNNGNAVSISSNVHCIAFCEEQAGYLAGYMAVWEGYTKFGFIGAKATDSITRYGYGYLQGIDDCANAFGISRQVSVNFWYADSFEPKDNIYRKAADWYQSGTEVIFSCGGSLYESVLKAANAYNGLLIGADVDQSKLSDHFLTSACKGVQTAVIIALDEYFAAGDLWPEDMAGKVLAYGADERCIELPTADASWRFQNLTEEDYMKMFTLLKSGDITVSDDTEAPPDVEIQVDIQN